VSTKRRGLGIIVAALVAGMTFGLAPAATAQLADLTEAVIYTARVKGGAAMTDEELVADAHARGTIEILRFWQGRELERIIVRLGEVELGVPGFTSMNRTAAEQAVKSGAKIETNKDGNKVVKMKSGGAEVDWTLPASPGVDPFVAEARLEGNTVYRETRHEEVLGKSGAVRPSLIRVDLEDGDALIQIFEYDGPSPTDRENPFAGFGPDGAAEAVLVETSTDDPAKAIVSSGGVRFTAMHGFVFEYDSGYWPGGGDSPGAFPVQVRLFFGAAWARGAEINGEFFIDSDTSNLVAGNASGNWWVDYGAELLLEGALNIPFIDPIVIDITDLIADNVDEIPTFDWRFQRTANFNSFLLNDGAPILWSSDRFRVFDLVDAILALVGFQLPDFIPLSAGVRLDGSIEAGGVLQTEALRLSDGTTFRNEFESRPVTIVDNSYSASVDIDSEIELQVILHAYPELFAEILFMRFDLPLGDLAVPIPIASIPMDFDPNTIAFNDIPESGDQNIDPGDGGSSGGDGGEDDGSGLPFVDPEEGETAMPEGEDATDPGDGGDDAESPLEALACTTFDFVDGIEPPLVNDFEQTVVEIEVAEAGLVEDLAVWVDLYHLRMADVQCSLESPEGAEVFLFSRVGGDSAHMQDSYFWDGAEDLVEAGAGPFGGVYRSTTPLSTFVGENAQGTWKLKVQDTALHNKGVLYDAKLLINPCNTDEIIANADDDRRVDREIHSLDFATTDGKLDLSELLRAIQLYNTDVFSCDPDSEDGYKTGPGMTDCTPHHSDFDPTDWQIELPELVRAIQLFNSGGYHAQSGSEDGFAAGAK